ncbi:MAG: hypothetical protein LC747_04320, partial [Acidobacteria bacterium]|nr:hypothetical protein [Acidobacteriota bacterium]
PDHVRPLLFIAHLTLPDNVGERERDKRVKEKTNSGIFLPPYPFTFLISHFVIVSRLFVAQRGQSGGQHFRLALLRYHAPRFI